MYLVMLAVRVLRDIDSDTTAENPIQYASGEGGDICTRYVFALKGVFLGEERRRAGQMGKRKRLSQLKYAKERA